MEVSVNYLLALEKSLRERLSQLKETAQKSAVRTIWDAKDKREEPVYDVKLVDKKILGLNKALFEINHKIKESNAKTMVGVSFNYDELISPIE